MFRRKVSTRILPVLIVTGSGGLAILRNMAQIGELPYTFMMHTSQSEVMDTSEALGDAADKVLPHVIGMKWDEENGTWIPLVEGAGSGAGKDISEGMRLLDAGKDVLKSDFEMFLDKIEEMESQRPNLAFFLDSLGGGTGSALALMPELLSKVNKPPLFMNLFTFPSEIEPEDAKSRAVHALRSIPSEFSAILIDYNHLMSDLPEATLSTVYTIAAEKSASIVYGLLELFINPEKVIQRADVRDVITSARPPFALVTHTTLSFFNPQMLQRNATAWPKFMSHNGRKMFVGYKKDPDRTAAVVIKNVQDNFEVKRTIVHAVNLGKNEAVIVVSPFSLDELGIGEGEITQPTAQIRNLDIG